MGHQQAQAGAPLLQRAHHVGGWFRTFDGQEVDGAVVWHPFHQEMCTLRLLPCTPPDHRLMRKVVRRLHRLRSDNLVPIHDLILRQGQVGLLEGEQGGYTLRDSLNEMGALELDEALAVFRQVIHAVSKLHSAKIVHGDLRPENVLLNVQDGVLNAKVRGLGPGLLGLAPADSLYLSPERISGAPADRPSDVFALGVMFYECLAGKRPFSAHTPQAQRSRFETAHLEPLHSLAPGLPMEVAFAVSSALKVDPGQRFADARSFGCAFPEDIVLAAPREEEQGDEPEITEIIDVPEPGASPGGTGMTATSLADAVGDIDWDGVQRSMSEELDAAEAMPSEPLGSRSVDAFLEGTRVARVLAVPALLATALLLMLTWQNITSAHETRTQTAAIQDELSWLVTDVEKLSKDAIAVGVEPNAVYPLVERYRLAHADDERRAAAATMSATLLRMVRSLPPSKDMQILQERRHLEIKLNQIHLQIQNYHASAERYHEQGLEPIIWLVDLLRL